MTKDGLALIVRHEGSPQHPYWPGGASGVTIGIGYDLAHHTTRELFSDWLDEGRITCPGGPMQVQTLLGCCGKSGEDARATIELVKDCVIVPDDAAIVFERVSLPKYESQTRHQAFPGADDLPDPAYSALVSLVFNRGPSMGQPGTPSWDSRKEMREIRLAVRDMDLQRIADELRAMKRLWIGKGLDGLLRRREDEAAMVESAIAPHYDRRPEA